ncbi:PAS domain S-box protein [Terriglobus aquaticus]|uniref:histidine kinase n=1 Tax=Terriglobus aquaticus TaxID=940139 RepID=A0ABW9KM37_9BACT
MDLIQPNTFRDDAKSLLQSIIASSEDAIVTKNLDGIVTSWNSGAQRIFGYEPHEMIGESIIRLIPDELKHEEDQILAKLRAGQRIDHFETIRVRKNGERFPISVTISPVKDETGTIIGASKIARDISDRRRAEESRARLAAIVDSADDAIISKDLNGIITSWNPGACRLFGYQAEEIVGESILRLIPDELKHEEEEILRTLRAGGKIEHYETTRLSKTGELREVSVTISPIRDSSGRVIGASKIARNIADRKKVERLAIQAEKLGATGRMAATIAHEINNPLASVMNLIYLAQQDDVSREEQKSYLRIAENELERISHIARQTLGYYRDTVGPVSVHLHDLVNTVLTVYGNKLSGQGITVSTAFNDMKKICVSSGEIIQVFSNVVANAIDAMPKGGTLNISVSRTMRLGKDGLVSTFSDTGRGISRDHVSQVFEPFFTTKGSLGTGIGLWVAKQIVERHGGQISLASSTETANSGTTITIHLPFISEVSQGRVEQDAL